MNKYISPETVQASGGACGRLEDLIRLGYIGEGEYIEPYIEPLPTPDEVFNSKLEPLLGSILQAERDTFERQEREARAFLLDSTAQVPFIQALAEARGLTVKVLTRKIVAKADYFSATLAKALGEKHKAEDLA